VSALLIPKIIQRGTADSERKSLHEHLHGLGEFLKGMKESIEERMERMESKMDEQHRTTERSMEALRSSLDRRAGGADKNDERVITRIDARCDGVERRLDNIAHAVGIRSAVSAGDDDEDRKRLKMRLKEALAIQNANERVSTSTPEGYLEYFFGIRPPNSRIGKQGSRCVWGWGVLGCMAPIAAERDSSIAGSSTHNQDSCRVRCPPSYTHIICQL
jgi:hypothetical protein